MAFTTIPETFGSGGSGLCDGTLKTLLGELQSAVTILEGLSFALVDGANADTDIALTGVTTDDELKFIVGFDTDNETPAEQVVDFTADFAITAADVIKAESQATAGYVLLVVWLDKS